VLHVVEHPAATDEVSAAAHYFDIQGPRLGDEFLDDYRFTLSRIAEAPEQVPRIRGECRKRNFARFPYAVIYRVRQGCVEVVAVMHLHRRPFYWKRRV
jgi:plasmid stabilization system protein ParE